MEKITAQNYFNSIIMTKQKGIELFSYLCYKIILNFIDLKVMEPNRTIHLTMYCQKYAKQPIQTGKVSIVLQNQEFLDYQQLLYYVEDFLKQICFYSQFYMYRIKDGNDSEEQGQTIDSQWKFSFDEVKENKLQTNIDIVIKSSLILLKKQIKQLEERCARLQQSNQQLNRKLLIQHTNNTIPTSQPCLGQHHSVDSRMLQQANTSLDLAFFFSQPLFDQISNDTENEAVSFQSQLQKILKAAKKGSVSQLRLRYEIATFANVSNIIRSDKPRVLHIICHGQKNGNLKFQHDSRIGILQRISPSRIQNLLESIEVLPEIVFINACHSEIIAMKFIEKGVSYVICIDSNYQIDDRAAEIFSQHFYMQLFKGANVISSFQSAKITVQQSKCNMKQCCCFHYAHQQGCMWPQIERKILKQQQTDAHSIYHTDPCKCPRKFENKHQANQKNMCNWAINTLFQINKHFCFLDEKGERIKPNTLSKINDLGFIFQEQDGKYLMVCCCFNPKKQPRMPPHSVGIQSEKFKKYIKENTVQKPFFKVVSTGNIVPRIIDQSHKNITQHLQKGSLNLKGRYEALYKVINQMVNIRKQQNIIVIHGKPGCGKSIFADKLVIYLTQRKQISSSLKIDLIKFQNIENYRLSEEKLNMTKWLNKEIRLNNFIYFDHCDKLLKNDADGFLKEIKQISQKHKKLKILLLHNTPTDQIVEDLYQSYNIFPYCQNLKQLNEGLTAVMLFQKLRDRLDTSFLYEQFYKMFIKLQPTFLCNPKTLQDFCNKLRIKDNKKITQISLKKAINSSKKQNIDPEIKEDENNKSLLQTLKQKAPEAHDLLLFIAQFEKGIRIDQIQYIFLLFQKQKNEVWVLPFKKNWFSNLKLLQTKFQIFKNGIKCSNNQQLQSITLMNENTFPPDDTVHIKQSKYFIQNLQNRLMVKNRLRIYIQKKYNDPISNDIKLFCMSIYSASLQYYFNEVKLRSSFHEDIISEDCLSCSGIFSKSVSFANLLFQLVKKESKDMKDYEFILQFQNRISKNDLVLAKIASKGKFIKNYKSNLLSFYRFEFAKMDEQISIKNSVSSLIFKAYWFSLLVLIPTALRFLQNESSLQKVYIGYSLNLLKSFKKKLHPDIYFEYFFKMKRIVIQCYLKDSNIAEIQNSFTQVEQLLSQMRQQMQIYQEMNKLIHLQQIHIRLYNLHKTEMLKYSKKQLEEKICDILKQLNQYQNKENVIFYKIVLLLCEIYLYVIDPHDQSSKILRQNINRKKQKADVLLNNLLEKGFQILKNNQCWKLYLQAYIYYAQLKWLNISNINITDRNSPLIDLKFHVQEAFTIYKNVNYKLSGFIDYERKLKQINRQINNKFSKDSNSRIVFLLASPLSSKGPKGEKPLLENFVRRPFGFKKGIAQILNHRTFKKKQSAESLPFQNDNFSIKKIKSEIQKGQAQFGILTKDNLNKQTEIGCSILVLKANTVFQKGNPYLIVEDQYMKEELIALNKKFTEDFRLDKINLLILIGKRSEETLQRLLSIMKNPPVMIALKDNTKQNESLNSQQTKQCIQQKLKFKKNEIHFITSFFRTLKLRQLGSIQELQAIVDKIRNQLSNPSLVKLIKKQNSHIYINFTEKLFDIKPLHTIRNHNIDFWFSDYDQYILKRPNQIKSIFEQIYNARKTKVALWKIIYSKKGDGKTYFFYELAKILIERKIYQGGVYYFPGSQINENYQGIIENYIQAKNKLAQLPNKDHFIGQSQGKILIMIDDFDLIKEQQNKPLFKQLDKAKAHILLSTDISHKKRQTFLKQLLSKVSLSITLKDIGPLQIDLYTSSIFEDWNEDTYKKIQEIKQQKRSVQALKQLAQYKRSITEKKNSLSYIFYYKQLETIQEEEDREENKQENELKKIETQQQVSKQQQGVVSNLS